MAELELKLDKVNFEKNSFFIFPSEWIVPSLRVGLCHWDLCVSRCCPPDWTQEEMKPRDRQ